MNYTLLLRLSAPMQSWGIDSKFEERRTEKEPTKSGIIGLLAAALGIPRDGDISGLIRLRFGVRVDREGTIIRDFHTAVGKKSGAVKKDSDISYVTNRYYLSDASFLVGLESDDAELMNDLAYALEHPVYALYLGRRSCPPCCPFVLGIKEMPLEQALENEEFPVLDSTMNSYQKSFRIIVDCDPDDADSVIRHDLPLSFNPEKREYGYRTVREYYIYAKTEEPEEKVFPKEHDAMSEL